MTDKSFILLLLKLGINDLSEQDLLELENTVQPLTLTFMPFHSFGNHMGESSRGMFLSEASVVRKLANDGACVILGRCADYVLEDMSNHFSIFVCANDEYREKRGKEVYEGKTLKEIKRKKMKKELDTTIITQVKNGAKLLTMI